MAEAQEKLLTEIRDLLVTAIEQERSRSDARDTLIAASLDMQRRAVALQRRTVLGGAVVLLMLLVVLVCAVALENR